MMVSKCELSIEDMEILSIEPGMELNELVCNLIEKKPEIDIPKPADGKEYTAEEAMKAYSELHGYMEGALSGWKSETTTKSKDGYWFKTTTGYDEGDKPIWAPIPISRDQGCVWKLVEELRKRYAEEPRWTIFCELLQMIISRRINCPGLLNWTSILHQFRPADICHAFILAEKRFGTN